MAGQLKLNGVTLATEENGNISLEPISVKNEIQLNGVTFATESGGNLYLEPVSVKDEIKLNSVSLATESGGAVNLDANVVINSGVVNIVSTTFTDVFSWTQKGSWTNLTGISASITPRKTSSKILVIVSLSTGDGGNNYERAYRVVRNGTVFAQGPSVSGMMVQAQSATGMSSYPTNNVISTIPITVIDSPSSTSNVTYTLQGYASSSSVTTSYINRPLTMASSTSPTGISTITLIEFIP